MPSSPLPRRCEEGELARSPSSQVADPALFDGEGPAGRSDYKQARLILD